jgi:hypothetical protein
VAYALGGGGGGDSPESPDATATVHSSRRAAPPGHGSGKPPAARAPLAASDTRITRVSASCALGMAKAGGGRGKGPAAPGPAGPRRSDEAALAAARTAALAAVMGPVSRPGGPGACAARLPARIEPMHRAGQRQH